MRAETIQAAIEGIEQVVASPDVDAAISRLLVDDQQKRLQIARERMHSKKAYVAVVGAQGTGKSSLLNGLLFTRRVLPIGEGTTTNVICRVEDAGDGKPRAEVVLKNGTKHVEPLELASLHLYVDESQNPGNVKGVRFIDCFAKAPLLHANTAFADTPGVGSLHQLHDAEAMAFAKDISLGIFVFRSTPTLTKEEMAYLDQIWPLCPDFVFVQNVWGESAEQIDASSRDNLAKIQEIARKHGGNDVTFLRVDIHAGLEGATNDQAALVENSGLTQLQAVIGKKIRRNGQAFEVAQRGTQIAQYLRNAMNAAQTEIITLHNSTGDVRQLNQLDAAEQELSTAQTRTREYEARFKRRFGNHLDSFREHVRGSIRDVRVQYHDQVTATAGRTGIEDAYLEQLKQRIGEADAVFQRGLRDICDSYITDAAAQIEDIGRALDFDLTNAGASVEDVTGTHLAETVGKVGAAAGGTVLTAMAGISASAFAGVIAQGGTTMAALAVASAQIPVAGWMIALGVVGAGLIVKAIAREKRRGALLKEIDKIAHDLEQQVIRHVEGEATKVRDHLLSEVGKEVRAAIRQKEAEVARIRKNVTASEETRRETEATLRRMISDLDGATTEIERLAQSVGRD